MAPAPPWCSPGRTCAVQSSGMTELQSTGPDVGVGQAGGRLLRPVLYLAQTPAHVTLTRTEPQISHHKICQESVENYYTKSTKLPNPGRAEIVLISALSSCVPARRISVSPITRACNKIEGIVTTPPYLASLPGLARRQLRAPAEVRHRGRHRPAPARPALQAAAHATFNIDKRLADILEFVKPIRQYGLLKYHLENCPVL